ncbi:MAG: PLP-dependent transferase [Bacteroidetes bacterium]|nr:PLP-dependent transferase [Bacteroidota bacterium]
MNKFSTRCVHAGTIKDDVKKGINSPIYTSTSFEYIDQSDPVYPRYLNTPNEKAAAEKIASLENTESALMFASGMAAISTVLFTFLGKGDHVVFQKGLYGGTSNFMEREFERFGIRFSIAKSQLADDMKAEIRENTALSTLKSQTLRQLPKKA